MIAESVHSLSDRMSKIFASYIPKSYTFIQYVSGPFSISLSQMKILIEGEKVAMLDFPYFCLIPRPVKFQKLKFYDFS